MNQRYPQHLAPADAPVTGANQHGIGRQFRTPGKNRGQIRLVDPAGPVQPAELFLRQPGANPGESFGFGQRLLERQVLVAVQGVVMDEIENRGLGRQHVIQMGHGPFDDLARIEGEKVGRTVGRRRGHGNPSYGSLVKIAVNSATLALVRAINGAG